MNRTSTIMKNRVFIETLGCAKNQVDSEVMAGLLSDAGYDIIYDPSCADVIIVNTCGFIGDAKEESVNAIFELLPYRVGIGNFSGKKSTEETGKIYEEGTCKKFIVSGCLSQRYANELLKEIPEVDTYIGTATFDRIVEVVKENAKGVICDDIDKNICRILPRKISKPDHYAYLKISEGCDNNCTYCIIPSLRGRYKSRSIDDIVEEADFLARKGIKELIIIAQDTSYYGKDIYGDFKLDELIRSLNEVEGIKWIRVQYCYPDSINEKMMNAVAECEKVVNYIDIPIQHASDKILKLMNRGTCSREIIRIVGELRDKIPDIVIRSTVIVGFPGETSEDFEELIDLIGTLKIDRLGAFKYSNEEGTAASELDNHIPEDVKEERYARLMEVQMNISSEKMNSFIGKELECVIEEEVCSNEEESKERVFIGRSEYDTPDVDGVIYIHTEKNLNVGDFIKVRVADALEYDLIGEI